MSRDQPVHRQTPGRFPRVSGDEPLRTARSLRAILFSPRERG